MKQTLNEQLSRIKQVMNAVTPILNEQSESGVCFNYDYIAMVAKKNGFKVQPDQLETNFAEPSNPENLNRNKELGLAKKSKMGAFTIEDTKRELDLDLFETDPYVYFYAETEEAADIAGDVYRMAKSKGFRAEKSNWSTMVYIDDKEGQTVECGNYEIIMRRIGRFAELMKILPPDFKLPYLVSTG